MSISAAHSAAARENSTLSTGPVTPDGKAKSSQNARKLGLFGAILFISDQEERSYNSLLDGYIEELRPETIIEHRHVREMVNAEWRLHLLRDSMYAYELSQIDPELASTPPFARAAAFGKMVDAGKALDVALRYEKYFQNLFEKSHRAFLEARRLRVSAQKTEARQEDQAMVGLLHSIANDPLPAHAGAQNGNLQNEAKPQPSNPPNPPFNPTVYTKAAPSSATPNLYKG
jgi:hypothetical protein